MTLKIIQIFIIEKKKINFKLPNGDIIDCWIYFLPKYPDSFIESQYYDNYNSNGSHGLQYVTSEDVQLLESAL